MDNQSTFLDLPLDRDLYKPKKIAKCDKPPLRILITEAGTKIALNLMYKLCNGEVFGPDQPLIIHLANARGCINHKATLLDLEECGFPVLEDSVVSAEPEKSYGKVDIVVLIALFEELSGHNVYNSFLCQLNKIRNVVRNTAMYAKPESKLVVCGPSTKGVIIMLNCIKVFEPEINTKHITGVVILDETISKALLAAQLKTTTDKIKNVVIWGATSPDIRNATVFMYPPDDKANLQKVEIPVYQVLEDEKWIYRNFIPKIYKRLMGSDLVKHGTAVASAAAKHLKILFEGTDVQDEIVAMGVIVPSHEPCGLPKDIGFALPVVTKNGEVTVREDVHHSITTQLMNIRSVYNFQHDPVLQEIHKLIQFIKDYEEMTKKEFLWNQHTYLTDRLSSHYIKYIMSPRHNEASTVEDKDNMSKKSITWEESHQFGKKLGKRNVKSVLRFQL